MFIYPDILLRRDDWTGYFYVGIGSLSAVLKENGYETSLFHITKPIRRSNFIQKVEKEAPDLIGFSSTSPMFPLVREYASWLAKAKMGVPTICGGIHPTIAPDEVIETPGIDMICRGEGEAALVELCRKIENNESTSNIQNIWIKRDGNLIKNPLRPLLEELDKLPFPDRDIFNYETLYGEALGKASFLVSRGCPYNCSYCCNHLIKKIYGSSEKFVRLRSVDNVIEEVKKVIEHYSFINTLNFDDDIFFFEKKWAKEFTDKYSRNINIPFTCLTRANITDKKMVGLLKRAGCRHVKLGIESGNERISNQVLNRHLSNERIKKAFVLCKEAGMITESFNMVGIPYDTPRTILDTIKLNAQIGVEKMQISIYQPYQGTKLAEHSRDQGFIVSKDLKTDWYSASLKLDTITGSQVLMFRDYFKVLVRYYQVIQRLPARISKILITLSDRILSLIITSKVLNLIYIPLDYLYRRILTLKLRVKIAWRKLQKFGFRGIKPVNKSNNGKN